MRPMIQETEKLNDTNLFYKESHIHYTYLNYSENMILTMGMDVQQTQQSNHF